MTEADRPDPLASTVVVLTLAADMDASETANFTVSDTSALSGTFTILVGTEQIDSCTVVDTTTISLGNRGANGTTARVHFNGDLVVEIPSSAVFVLAGHECDAIGDIYALDNRGEKVRFEAPVPEEFEAVLEWLRKNRPSEE